MILVRKAVEGEVPIIQDLAKSIWPVAYQSILSSAQIDYMLEKMYSETALQEQMRDGHIYLIALQHDQYLGFAGFSLVDATTKTYKLHKLYVLPSAQGKGLGKILVNEVIGLVREAFGTALQLNVNRNNKALGFYTKSGFTIQKSVDIDIGRGYFMNDYVMERRLV